MLARLRKLYWRLKYRPGRTVTFCFGYDGFHEILVVESRLATAGTLVYRERGINVRAQDQEPFGPPREDTIPDIVRRLTTFPGCCPRCGRDLRSIRPGCSECEENP